MGEGRPKRKPPALTAKHLVRLLKAHGYVEDRQRGSHLTLIHTQTRKSITVPVHTGADVGKGLLHRILKAADIPLEAL
jgi:predicted RNA binding protein YcfA (HicA-like mRNA interferase family)